MGKGPDFEPKYDLNNFQGVHKLLVAVGKDYLIGLKGLEEARREMQRGFDKFCAQYRAI